MDVLLLLADDTIDHFLFCTTHYITQLPVEVQGFGGNFMTDETTIKYLRTDYYEPKVFNRLSREEWVKAGSRDINARAKERITKLMKEHEPEPLEAGVKKELRALVRSKQ